MPALTWPGRAACSTRGFAKQALADGADGVLIKPLTIEFVRRKVDVLLGRR